LSTDPDTVRPDIAAGTAAAKKFIEANVPFWARNLITDQALESLVRKIVAAVDEARRAGEPQKPV
jgi:hypothetical protein